MSGLLNGIAATLFGWLPGRAPRDNQEQFARREAELQRRLFRLEREVDVVQRVETSEDSDR